MSMLTPPGMGGKYRITGAVHPRMRRRRGRPGLVFAAVGAVLAVALIGWGTTQLIDVFSGDDGEPGAARHRSAGCQARATAGDGHGQGAQARSGARGAGRAPAGTPPKPADLTVNVYNATQRKDLAKRTAADLRARGFRVGRIGNAPAEYDKKVKSAGLLLGSPAAARGALPVLATQVHGAQTRSDGRRSDDVDLVIGDGFTGLTARPQADRALEALRRPSPAPSVAGC
ncbi:LytR C-terminal domain-containing protein [Streptomyces sp. B1866]|uniref:LytR C-terminal domain-containing protein n=1 Tax=Streptomyces sp. B1866 TaxID=3075431 RepID=UPI00288DAA38|nr:LytR C-terminal domain-containing protein [Streptomyces sp. B1866]MDT3396457.1 LytR C-terminal domain-containing protein [Streptomyces sp. B1866]